ncbi:MAG TPA: LysE family translocator [Burkholderiaceae bacterium]|nr:LysE family translocator [Burkholderiaceae bacterium]
MSLTLPAAPVLAAFALASLVLAATPGPGVLYIVTRTLSQGRRAGLASVAGVALGNLGNALAAALGLAALLAVSTLAFELVKWAGAAYLLWLGWKALRAPLAAPGAAPREAPALGRIVRDGFVVALLNPKTALFFAAFLPQFIDARAPAAAQSVLFGAAFVAIAACTDSAYVLAARAAAPALAGMQRGRAIGRTLTAAVYVGLALFTAASGSRATR